MTKLPAGVEAPPKFRHTGSYNQSCPRLTNAATDIAQLLACGRRRAASHLCLRSLRPTITYDDLLSAGVEAPPKERRIAALRPLPAVRAELAPDARIVADSADEQVLRLALLPVHEVAEHPTAAAISGDRVGRQSADFSAGDTPVARVPISGGPSVSRPRHL